MTGNISRRVIYFPAWHDNAGAVPAVADWEVAITADAELGVWPIVARCQVVQFGCIITTAWGTQTTDAILTLKTLGVPGTDISTAATLVSFTIGEDNTKLSFPTVDLTAVAAGGPGTVVTGPGLGGNRTAFLNTAGKPGCVLLAPDGSLPTTIIKPGQFLSVSVTGSSGGSEAGKVIAFAVIEEQGDNYELLTVATSGVTAGT